MERKQSILSLEEQLRCPVCLDVFTEPLMLQCGHSYCRCCVGSMTVNPAGQLQCPVCRSVVSADCPPPNVSLARIIDTLQQEDSGSAGFSADMCSQHQSPLVLYCEDERAVICGLCGSIGSHRGHKITPVSSVYSRMKEDISGLMSQFQSQRHNMENEMCKMANNKSRITNESDVLKWVVRKEFGELRRCLEVEEARFMSKVELTAANLISSIQSQAESLSHALNRLQEAESTLGDLSNEGPLDFIMKFGSIAPSFRQYRTEFTGFSSVNFRPGFNHSDIKLSVWKSLQRRVLPAPEVLILDSLTAHPMLEMSAGGRHVVCGSTTRRFDDNPERFTFSYCVLTSRGFNNGKHYWEVYVGNKPKWRLGVIKGTANRKAKLTKSPEGGAWLIGLRDGRVYEAFSCPRVTLPVSAPLCRVGMFLDYEAGHLTFYGADSPDELLFIYSFRAEFHGKIFPLFDVCWHDRGGNTIPLSIPEPIKDLAVF